MLLSLTRFSVGSVLFLLLLTSSAPQTGAGLPPAGELQCCIGDGTCDGPGRCFSIREFLGFHYCTNQGKVDCGAEEEIEECSDYCCPDENACIAYGPPWLNGCQSIWSLAGAGSSYDFHFDEIKTLCEGPQPNGRTGVICGNEEAEDWGYCPKTGGKDFKSCCLNGCDSTECYTQRDFIVFWYDYGVDCGNYEYYTELPDTGCNDWFCIYPPDDLSLAEEHCKNPQAHDNCVHIKDLPMSSSPPFNDVEWVCEHLEEVFTGQPGTICENRVEPWFDADERDDYGYCTRKGFTGGDPHIQTWSQQWYDFMGECSLVFLRALDFAQGLGLEIHIRTKVRFDYSYIESAVIKIGNDVLEVLSYGTYIVNGVQNADLSQVLLGGLYHVNYEQPSDKESKFLVELSKTEHVVFHVFKDLVSVKVEGATYESFGTSQGLMGEFGTGRRLARNGTEVSKDDVSGFASNWQVLETEPMLFQTALGPQHPHACRMPDPTLVKDHRRLLGDTVTEEDARVACHHWEHVEPCVYDVMKTGDLELANSEHY